MKKAKLTFSLLLLLFLLCGRPFFLAGQERPLKVGFDPYLPPFQFINDEGEFCGLNVDLLRSIGQRNELSLQFIPYENRRDMLADLKSGKLSLVLGVRSPSKGSLSDFLESQALSDSRNSLFVPRKYQNNAHITTCFFASEDINHMLLANLDVYTYIACSSQKKVCTNFLDHPDAAMLGIKDCLEYYLDKEAGGGSVVRRYSNLERVEFKLFMNPEDIGLLRMFNQGITEVKTDPSYEKMLYCWLPQDNPEYYRRLIYQRAGLAIGLFSLVTLAAVLFMRRLQKMLQRKVQEQTRLIEGAREKLEKQYSLLEDAYDLRNRIVKYAPTAMLVFDREYRVVMANSSAVALCGKEQIEVGSSLLELPLFAQILKEAGNGIFEKGFLIEGKESAICGRHYRYSIYQVYHLGEVSGIVLNAQDITREEEMKQNAYAKDKSDSLMRLAAGIAHEIRNPLMAIQTFARLIGERGEQKEVQESFSKYVPSEVDRINKLIESLLNYARPSQHGGAIISVNDAISNCLTLMRSVLKGKPYPLKVTLNQPLYAFGNANKLQQVLINLLLNSMDALDRKLASGTSSAMPAFELSASVTEEGVEIQLYDEGVGMSPEVLASCTKPFFTTKEIGTGIGLSLCEQYISEAGGRFLIESEEQTFCRIRILLKREVLS